MPLPILPAPLLRAARAPVAVLVLHHLGSTLFGHEPYVDPVMHTLGGAAIAYFVWCAVPLATPSLGSLRPAGQALLAFALASTVAVVWEMGEFSKPFLLGGEIDTGLANTMRDLVCGMSGASVAVAWLLCTTPRSRAGARAGSIGELT